MSHRRLPHIYPPGKDLFFTCQLHSSLPEDRYPPPGAPNAGAAFVWMDRFLDAAQSGPMWLADDRIAKIVEGRIVNEPGCEIHAYVIMSNHFHLLITPRTNPAKLMQSIKGGSAREINLLLGQTGKRFWQWESYDHWVRTPDEWSRIKRYIENNPVTAGLVKSPSDYRYSSAYRGASFSLQANFSSP